MKIKKLFEDKTMVVLDKPAGIAVHGDGKSKDATVATFILKTFKKIKDVGEPMDVVVDGKEVNIPRPGIVHRLDKDTSGCLIVAKTQDAYDILKLQFQDRQIKKEYAAIVAGHPKYDTGLIDLPIARSNKDFRKKEVVKHAFTGLFRGEERSALTRYRVDKKFLIDGMKVAYVTFLPETGRMHQIRVHAKSFGHPIVGDHMYGMKNAQLEKSIFGRKKVRQLLHAKSLVFTNLLTGERTKVESKLPTDFPKI